jgi:hypothetical protein
MFRSATLGLKFDPEKIAVRTVTFGDVFGETNASKTANPYLNKDGKMFVSLSLESGAAPGIFGILAYVEIEALSDCKPLIEIEKEAISFLSAEGKTFAAKF